MTAAPGLALHPVVTHCRNIFSHLESILGDIYAGSLSTRAYVPDDTQGIPYNTVLPHLMRNLFHPSLSIVIVVANNRDNSL